MKRFRVKAIACSVSVASLLALSGCGGASDSADPETDFSVDTQSVALLVETSLEQDISDNQREILEKGKQGEAVEYADLTYLLEDMLNCFETGGVNATVYEPLELAPDVLIPNFTYSEGNSEETPVADFCQFHHYTYAAWLYEMQPRTVEGVDAEWARNTPAMLECLRNAGFAIEDDATRAEVEAAIDEVLIDGGPMCDYRAWLE